MLEPQPVAAVPVVFASTLHARVAGFLATIAGQYLPAEQLAKAASIAGALHAARGMLKLIPGLKDLPDIPAIPATIPALQARLAAEVAARPTEEVEAMLAALHTMSGAWLAEYQDSIQDSIAPAPEPEPEPEPEIQAPEPEPPTDDASDPAAD